jgi:two-component system, chemotaxis family, CheB/CheR fusion protein
MSPKISIAASKTVKRKKPKIVPIVAIGASAGGLEAVTMLLKKLPSNTGMAYVYIQHLDPDHKSLLTNLLAKATKMKVTEAKHLKSIEPDHLYVIPPDKDMTFSEGKIVLAKRKGRNSVHLPIDSFFSSLADNQTEGVIGVLLSGSGSDGTIGMRAIKVSGGLTFAQDDSAKFQNMPKSAVGEGVVDLVLSPAEIAKELERISHQADSFRLAMDDQNGDHISNTDEDLVNIVQLLRKSIGVDFTHYKMNTIKRRIIRRMLLCKLATLKDYYQYLRHHTHEVNLLYQDLLINVTSFFRDADAMEYLKKNLLPRLLKNKSANDPFRVWIPACSTGEEAYSLAIILMEVLGDKAATPMIQIFATDLSEPAIAKARLGFYSRTDVINIAPKRLQRFFTKVDGGYRIIKSIRDMCIFAPHNIFKDPPFSRLDLVSCCNLMIYLDAVLQKKIISIFHYSLNTNGVLILGKSEAINTPGRLFSQIEKKYKIYLRKKEPTTLANLDIGFRVPLGTMGERGNGSGARKSMPKEVNPEGDLEKMIDNILLTQYVPSCVVVNSDLEILQFRGSTGKFLEPSPGKASLNLLKMAKPGLAFELRNAVHKASKTMQPVQKTGLETKTKNITHRVSLEVVPLRSVNDEKLFIVIFDDMPIVNGVENKPTLSRDKIIKKLQDELMSAKEDMRSIIEEQEASNEELQSANEEVVSSNEELQSINEELETSKEEVESTNEELMTINTELQVRNEQLVESYEYAEAVFSTIREAVLVLDHDLRVKTANKAFYKIFKTNEEDTEGVYVYELGDRQWNIPKLRQLLEEIIPQNGQFSAFEVRHTFTSIGEKVLLLNARKIVQKIHKQQLILLAIEDVTEHKQAEKIISGRESWFRNMADNAPVMIWVMDSNKLCTFLNRTWLDYTGRRLQANKGNDWIDAIYPDDVEEYLKNFHLSFNDRKPFQLEYRLRKHTGEFRWIMDVGKPTYTAEGEFTGYLGSCTEIHDKKVINEELENKVSQRTHDLIETNKNLSNINNELEQFAYVASHDLQEPLRKILTFADRLLQFKNEIPEEGKVYIDKISSSTERMSQLIDDLLNFSRTSSANNKFERTDLNRSLKDVLDDFELIMSQKMATIKADPLPTIPAVPLQIHQLFHNLISNALKFAKEDQPCVINIKSRTVDRREVSNYKMLDSDRNYIELIFSDNGIGFNPEFAAQIFVIFQRAHYEKKYQGTGIGLALCRKIVNNHHGEIYAESEENKGATFHIILPSK